jgi:hypothetical protein
MITIGPIAVFSAGLFTMRFLVVGNKHADQASRRTDAQRTTASRQYEPATIAVRASA